MCQIEKEMQFKKKNYINNKLVNSSREDRVIDICVQCELLKMISWILDLNV